MGIPVQHKITSYILKCIVVVSAVAGVLLSYYAGRYSFMGGSRVFMFFTIQSNIAIAVICLIGGIMMMKDRAVKDYWYVIKFVGTVAITLTGVVFCFVLAPTMGSHAWRPHNVLTHVIVPLAAVFDFFVTGRYGKIKKKYVLFVTLPPLAYVIYAGIGYVAGWQFAEGINYPYFFLNWGSPAGAFGFTKELPYMGCVWWILALFVFLIIVGYIYLKILDLLARGNS